MKTKLVIEIENPHEIARLLSLLDDGKRILRKQNRTQRGIDGYTRDDLSNWDKVISQTTRIRCEYVDDNI